MATAVEALVEAVFKGNNLDIEAIRAAKSNVRAWTAKSASSVVLLLCIIAPNIKRLVRRSESHPLVALVWYDRKTELWSYCHARTNL